MTHEGAQIIMKASLRVGVCACACGSGGQAGEPAQHSMLTQRHACHGTLGSGAQGWLGRRARRGKQGNAVCCVWVGSQTENCACGCEGSVGAWGRGSRAVDMPSYRPCRPAAGGRTQTKGVGDVRAEGARKGRLADQGGQQQGNPARRLVSSPPTRSLVCPAGIRCRADAAACGGGVVVASWARGRGGSRCALVGWGGVGCEVQGRIA